MDRVARSLGEIGQPQRRRKVGRPHSSCPQTRRESEADPSELPSHYSERESALKCIRLEIPETLEAIGRGLELPKRLDHPPESSHGRSVNGAGVRLGPGGPQLMLHGGSESVQAWLGNRRKQGARAPRSQDCQQENRSATAAKGMQPRSGSLALRRRILAGTRCIPPTGFAH